VSTDANTGESLYTKAQVEHDVIGQLTSYRSCSNNLQANVATVSYFNSGYRPQHHKLSHMISTQDLYFNLCLCVDTTLLP
jgi:hypothetical protein